MPSFAVSLPHRVQYDFLRRGSSAHRGGRHDAVGLQPTTPLLRPCLRGRHGPGRTHSRESPAAHSNFTLNWDKCLLLKSHASRNHVYNAEGGMVKETAHAKYLGVILSSNGTARKDVNERLAKARKHFSTLHHFWRHSGLPAHWRLRIYNAVFIPMLTYGMGSASLSQHDLHRLEAFHSKGLGKMHRIPPTFYTKILEPTQPTTTNQQLREQTSQPPLTHHIHRAQLKLFGHILRAQDKCLERDCCFTKAFFEVWYARRWPKEGKAQNTPGGAMCRSCLALAPRTRSYPDTSSFPCCMYMYIFTGWLPVATSGAS